MKDFLKKLFKEPIVYFCLAFIILMVVLSFFEPEKSSQNSFENETNEQVPVISEEIPLMPSVLTVDNNCDFSGLGDYKFIDIFENTKENPSQQDYRYYTKEFNISGKIEDAYLCILSDVLPKYKSRVYAYGTYFWIGDEQHSGNINVGYNPDKKVLYDNSTDTSSPFLTGRFNGNETPFRHYVNLKSVYVANMNDRGYKVIKPLQRLQLEGGIRIGGFVNTYPNYQIGRILKMRIFYKGGDIEPTGAILK